MSEKELHAAMASLEDADGVEASRALEREAAYEHLELDENGGSGGTARRLPPPPLRVRVASDGLVSSLPLFASLSTSAALRPLPFCLRPGC